MHPRAHETFDTACPGARHALLALEELDQATVQVQTKVLELSRQEAQAVAAEADRGATMRSLAAVWHPAATGGMLVSNFMLHRVDDLRGSAPAKGGLRKMFPNQKVCTAGMVGVA
jgi:hypothetical protein